MNKYLFELKKNCIRDIEKFSNYSKMISEQFRVFRQLLDFENIFRTHSHTGRYPPPARCGRPPS